VPEIDQLPPVGWKCFVDLLGIGSDNDDTNPMPFDWWQAGTRRLTEQGDRKQDDLNHREQAS
jgi:hypothetical protein